MESQAGATSFPNLSFLSPRVARTLLESSYRVLERTGVRLYSASAVDLLRQAGAEVADDRVRIPRALILSAIESVPSAFSLFGRDGRKSIRVESGSTHYGPGLNALLAIDEQGKRRSPFLRSDTRTVARLCDALPNFDFVTGLGTITDVPDELAGVYELVEVLSCSCKPIAGWGSSLANLEDMHEIASLVVGGREKLRQKPLFTFGGCTLSPLVHTPEGLDQMIYCAEHYIPYICVSAPLGGGTAPTTVAGEIVQTLVEALSGLVIHQLKQPGAPFAMGFVATTMDMRSTTPAYGGPETSLLQMALSRIASLLGIPSFVSAGISDSKSIDAQLVAEVTISQLAVSLSGPSLVFNAGLLESTLAGSALMLVVSDEIIGRVRSIRAKPDTSHELPCGSPARGTDEEGYMPGQDRRSEDPWQVPTCLPFATRRAAADHSESRGQDFIEYCQQKLVRILETHSVPPLAKPVNEAIEQVLFRSEERLRILRGGKS